MYRALIIYVLYIASFNIYAQNLTVQVVDIDGKAIEGAIVELKRPGFVATAEDSSAVMDQVNRQFKPRILVVQQGTLIGFPNSDSIKHHVYSFSAAKRFQLRLYKDRQPDPLLFDKAGVVALGCNIHDWMSGYIYVAQSQLYRRTDQEGKAVLTFPTAIPTASPNSDADTTSNNDYQLHVWHPRLKANDVNRIMKVSFDSKELGSKESVVFQLQETMHPALDDSADEFDAY